MITGVVNAQRRVIVRLRIRGTGGQEMETEAMIDTGFDASLSLRPDQIALLQLPYITQDTTTVADGSETTFDVYQAVVVWDGQDVVVFVDESDVMPCVGMSLLEGYDLSVRAVIGGPVTITKAP